jgi:hypothetical protein
MLVDSPERERNDRSAEGAKMIFAKFLLRTIKQKMISIFAAACCLVISPDAGFAQLLDYSTFAGYGLGKGILGNDLGHPLPACVTGTQSKLPASHANIRVSITYSAYEYKQAFHIDQSAQVSVLDFGSGGDEMHIGRETGSSGSAFDIVIEAYGEHDSDTIGNVRWDAPYDAMVASGDDTKIRHVRETCGDRFIETVFSEVRLFAVLHVSSQKTSSLTTFSGKANGSVNVDVISASASLGGDANISSANKSGAISIDIFSEGFGGVIPTAQAVGITSADGLVNISNKLMAYLGTLHETGQPVKYQLAPLPGIPSGNLTDSRIFEKLSDLKQAYLLANARSSNVKALLLPTDPRRLVLRQPQADSALTLQKASLSRHLDEVSEAHEACRKASQLSVCNAAIQHMQPAPEMLKVELPILLPPSVGPYYFAINGVPVPPAQNSVLFSNTTTTLFEAARALNSATENVDVLAYIPSAYMSHLDVLSIAPQPPYLPLTVGGGRILPQEMVPPAYFPANAIGSTIRVYHADAQHPCPIRKSLMLNTIDQNCLTAAGRVLRDALLSDVANYVVGTKLGAQETYNFPLMAVLQDCFGPGNPAPIGMIGIKVTATPGQPSATYTLFLPMAGIFLPLIEASESETPSNWQHIKQMRIAAFSTTGAALAASGACGPHIQ